ncbi:MAG TPA: dynamin family protein [Candidatus Sulfotelmatobacter sp.]|nr:dynamin family protein [Candidatus Sulfotelmatobacter sp.]
MGSLSDKLTAGGTNHPAATSTHSSEVVDTAGKLNRLAELAEEFDSERAGEEAKSLAERLMEGRFYVACIGQFKRGKSTLLNALVGDPVLPTGVVPITAVPTIVRHGEKRSARVRFQGGAWRDIAPEELVQYVSEEQNPENAKNVAGVEVFVPSALLADGMCLVDTPGLGSIFAGNTAATQAFVPQIDAAIIVVGADPPIAGEELGLVEEVGKQVRQLLVVLNKADRATDAERQIAGPFTRKVLEKRLGRAIGPIYEVSALERQEKQASGWDWDPLVASLQRLVDESGRTLVRAAGQRGLQRLGEEMLLVTLEEREALVRPIEESERRIATMHNTTAETERSLRELGYLFMAEKHRLSDLFLERRKRFLRDNLGAAKSEVDEECQKVRRGYGPRFRREAMHMAQVVAANRVLPWLTREQAEAEAEYRKVAGRFVNIGNEFLQKLSESRIPELARMPNALNSEQGFRMPSHFRFEQLINVAQPASPLRYLADIVLGRAGASLVIQKQALAFLEYLMEMNSTRVQSDLMERVEKSQSQLEAEIRKLLHEVTRVAAAALEHARIAKSRGAAAVEEKLQRISEVEREIRAQLGT